MHRSNIMICVGCHKCIGGVQSIGGYSECIGGVQCTGGYQQCIGEISVLLLEHSQCTDNIFHTNHDTPNALMISPNVMSTSM